MKTHLTTPTLFLAALVAAALLAVPAQAADDAGLQELSLLPAAATDLVASETEVPAYATLTRFPSARPEPSQEPVSFAWKLEDGKLDDGAALANDAQPVAITSQGYWLNVSAEELSAGVDLFTTSPAAVVRINPEPARGLSRVTAPVQPMDLEVQAGGATFGAGTAMEMLVSAEKLAAADTPFPEGTTAFRFKEELGAGTFQVQAPGLAGNGRYVIHVQEPRSTVRLEMASLQANYLNGDSLDATVALADDGQALGLEGAEAIVVSPRGRFFPVTLEADGSLYRASLPLAAQESGFDGLWELQVQIRSTTAEGLTVLRSGRTAFAVAVPTARLQGTAQVARAGEGLSVTVPVEAATAGRYELRGVLYGGVEGDLQPLAIAHSANWLTARGGAITLTFGLELLEAAPKGATFEIRDLRLLDQGRMALLERRARGIAIP